MIDCNISQSVMLAATISPVYMLRYADEPENFLTMSLEEINRRSYKIEFFSRILGFIDYEINSFRVMLGSPLTFIIPVPATDKETALELAKRLVFYLFLGGLDVIGIRENDIGVCEVNKHGYYMLLEPHQEGRFKKNLDMQQRCSSPLDIIEYFPSNVITFEYIIKILETGKILASKFSIAHDFLLEGLRFFKEKEYTPSFIFLFTALESTISSYWIIFIKDRKLRKSKKVLTNKSLPLSIKIEFLRLSNIISEDVYEVIDNARKKRNDVIHSTSVLCAADCKNCIRALEGFLTSILPDDKKYLNRAFSRYLIKHKKNITKNANDDNIYCRLNPMPGSSFFEGHIPECKTCRLAFSPKKRHAENISHRKK